MTAAKRKPAAPVLDPEPIRLQTAHGLVCLLYRRQPPPPQAPVYAPSSTPPWMQPDLDDAREAAIAAMTPEQRSALGL